MANRESFNIKDMNNIERIIENFPVGTHDVRAVSMRKDESTSGPTEITEITKIQVFGESITASNVDVKIAVTGCEPYTPTRILHGCAQTLDITPHSGYKVSGITPTVSGATIINYNKLSNEHAVLKIKDPTSNVSISTIGEELIKYNITAYLVNVDADGSNPSFIYEEDTATLKFIPQTDYKLPETVTVTGTDYLWDKESGELYIYNPSSNIEITIAGVQLPNYLCFIPELYPASSESNYDVEIFWNVTYASGTPVEPNLSYSFDKKNWTNWALNTSISVPERTPVYLRGNNEQFNYCDESYENQLMTSFVCNIAAAGIHLSGNIMSLLDPTCQRLDISGILCFSGLFDSFKISGSAPELPATTLSEGCYVGLFYGCTNLTTAPTLPAETLSAGCYASMFYGCTNLTDPPAMYAKTLANQCCGYMFYGCTNLESAPVLLATELVEGCYQYMFNGCTNLKSLAVAFTDWKDSEFETMPTNNWVSGLPSNGTFISYDELSYRYGESYIPEYWNKTSAIKLDTPTITLINNVISWTEIENAASYNLTITNPDSTTEVISMTNLSYTLPESTLKYKASVVAVGAGFPYENSDPSATVIYNGNPDYLCFTANEAGSTAKVYLNNPGGEVIINLFYSIDKQTWYKLIPGSYSITPTTITLENVGDKVYLSGTNDTFAIPGYVSFNLTGSIAASGDLTTLLEPEGNVLDLSTRSTGGTFKSLFSYCSSLTSAPKLPSTTLTYNCYNQLFYGCTNLTTAPALPATTLAYNCYNCMFQNCTSLTTVGEISAEILAESCCYSMFWNCTSLVAGPASLPATTLASNCYNRMFGYCSSLTSAPELPATTLAAECYAYMFDSCTSLTTAPELPATTLEYYCYSGMFEYCTSLVNIPTILSAQTLASGCYYNMFNNCTALTNTPELPAEILSDRCYSDMFNNCTGLLTTRSISGKTLDDYSCDNMFSGCSSLATVPEMHITSQGYSSCGSMFGNCSSITDASCIEISAVGSSSCSFMFGGCIALVDPPILSATTLDSACYLGMFNGCTSLIRTPVLPATTMEYECYYRMFENCTNLTTSPELPASTLTDECYTDMFNGCTKLNAITALFDNWYNEYDKWSNATYNWVNGVAENGTFTGSSNLLISTRDASHIPASWSIIGAKVKLSTPTISISGDTVSWNAITDATGYEISATYEGGTTYSYTVNTNSFNASSLSYGGHWNIKVRATNADARYVASEYSNTVNYTKYVKLAAPVISISGTTVSWAAVENATYYTITVTNPSSTVKTYTTSNTTYDIVSLVDSDGAWKVKVQAQSSTVFYTISDYSNEVMYNAVLDFLCFTANTAGSTVELICGSYSLPSVSGTSYSTDKTNWTTFTPGRGSGTNVVTLTNIGDKVYFRNNINGDFSTGYYLRFVMTGSIAASGNINSMYTTTNFENLTSIINRKYCYYRLFAGCAALTAAPKLPANQLSYGCYSNMFNGCKSLVSAPELPATGMNGRSYEYMFNECTALTTPPEILPATDISRLGLYCYQYMFYGCRSLTTAPKLPDTALSKYCYYNMFAYCTSLTTAPELPATTLAEGCYSSMFYQCWNLSTAPELPATTLADYCYSSMFEGCNKPIMPSKLPATTLAESCYSSMFASCNLTTVPALPATTLADYCYSNMFYNNTTLKVSSYRSTNTPYFWRLPAFNTFTNTSTQNNMFRNCGESGSRGSDTLYAYSGQSVSYYTQNQPIGEQLIQLDAPVVSLSSNIISWEAIDHAMSYNIYASDTFIANTNDTNYALALSEPGTYIIKVKAVGDNITYADSSYSNYIWYTEKPKSGFLCFTANTAGSTVELIKIGSPSIANTAYSTDGINWTTFTPSTSRGTNKITLANVGDKVYFVNDINGNFELSRHLQFVMSGSIAASGNINSLRDSITFGKLTALNYEYCYCSLFDNCTSLTTPPELPATVLSAHCYRFMFYNCKNLAIAPALPATTATTYCYSGMFYGCSELAMAPELPATSLSNYCYSGMFNGCTSINAQDTVNKLTAHIDFTSTLVPTGLQGIFAGLAITDDMLRGVLGESYSLPATTLSEYCYQSMFSGCTSLTTAPNLPATTLAKDCYESMFAGCANLVTMPNLPATTMQYECYLNMFNGCTNLVSVQAVLPATSLATRCYKQMFSGCSNLLSTPTFLATSLDTECCFGMFRNCTSLTTANIPTVITLKDSCYRQMFYGCTSLTTAPELPATTLASACYYEMFSNCSTLVTPPELHVTTLADSCYYLMFSACTSLVTPPALPATTLAEDCYGGMFSSCTSLNAAPELPATTLLENCYREMFYMCTSLTTALALPATTLAEGCYSSMFKGCASLISVPELPATSLKSWCYYEMFYNCTSLQVSDTQTTEAQRAWRIPTSETFTNSYTQYNMFYNCAGARSSNNMPGQTGQSYTYYTQNEPIPKALSNLCFTANTANSTIELMVYEDEEYAAQKTTSLGLPISDTAYSTNGTTWTTFTPSTTAGTNVITLANVGDKVYFRNNITGNIEGYSEHLQFVMSGSIAASGNCNSIYDATNFEDLATLSYECCYYGLFSRCDALTAAPKLPASTLSYDCYAHMFENCTNLHTMPELPATNLADCCYYSMFNSCTSLTIVSPLPASTLISSCYENMFANCTSLTEAPEIFATELDSLALCEMFYYCSSLSTIKTHFAFWDDPDEGWEVMTNWVYHTSTTGTFYVNEALPIEYGSSRIPNNWTVKPHAFRFTNNLNAYVTADSSNPTTIPADGSATLHYTSTTYKINSVNLTNATYTVTYNSDYDITIAVSNPTDHITVNVDVDAPVHQISCTVSPEGSATVAGTGSYTLGSTVTLTAVPATSYVVDKWTRGTTEYTTKSISFIVDKTETISLVMKEVPYWYEVQTITGAAYGFTKNENDYYESTNQGKNATAAVCKVVFNAGGYTMYLDCINYGEEEYDFGLISKPDHTLTLDYKADDEDECDCDSCECDDEDECGCDDGCDDEDCYCDGCECDDEEDCDCDCYCDDIEDCDCDGCLCDDEWDCDCDEVCDEDCSCDEVCDEDCGCDDSCDDEDCLCDDVDEESKLNSSNDVLYSFRYDCSEEVIPIAITNDSEDHFIYVKYRKDDSDNYNNDSLQFKVRFENE